jgi:hypothetical protein
MFQYHKLHLFNTFFKQWDYIFYLDCGITIFSNIEPIIQECKKNILLLAENIFMYDTALNKKHWHGSLCNGIYNNMQYAIEYFTFDYFIVTSSRNFFGNGMKIEDLNRLKKLKKPYIDDHLPWSEKQKEWMHSSVMNDTLLVKYFLERNQDIYYSPHEGLVLTYKGCKKITEFLENEPDIKNNIFNVDIPAEEMALQTISMNFGETFFYIGNGCCSNDPVGTNSPDSEIIKFMYKTER